MSLAVIVPILIIAAAAAGPIMSRVEQPDYKVNAADKKLATVGEPLLAFYNPSWTLPFFRRNEIMLELGAGSG